MMNGSIETFTAFIKKIVSDKLCQQVEIITVKEKDGRASRLIQKYGSSKGFLPPLIQGNLNSLLISVFSLLLSDDVEVQERMAMPFPIDVVMRA